MKIGEHANIEGCVTRKKLALGQMAFRWRNRIFEEKVSSVQELCFQHSGGGKKIIKREPECLILI